MDTRRKYWLIYAITAFIVLAIVAAVLLLFLSDLSDEERRFAEHLAPKLAAYAAAGMVANLLLFSSLLKHIFKTYIDPIVKLTEETQLIAVANAKYRIVPAGGREVVALTGVINDLADKHIALKTDVQQIVQYSKTGLDDEKRRLEALMAQIPQGVIVCNVDGRILLYNHQARRILETHGDGAEQGERGSALGLGRSVFGALDREPIIFALNALQNRLDQAEERPAFDFTTSRRSEQFLRVRMAAVTAAESAALIDGYILTLTDVTEAMRADSRRDIFLQSLTIALQQELARIHDAALALEGSPVAKDPALGQHTAIIGTACGTLLEMIDEVAVQHARRLDDPGQAEHILAHDLMSVLRETLVEKFGIEVELSLDHALWLSVNSYTVVRGVVYLLGQLTSHLEVRRVHLDLQKVGEAGQLSVTWHGDPVAVATIEAWRQCPLMTQTKDRSAVGLANLLAGRGDVSSAPADETTTVRFRLDVEKPESKWSLESRKVERPVFYEFDLFDTSRQKTDSDHLALSELEYVVFDTETTGLDPTGGDEIISIGAIRIVQGKVRREQVFDQLVDPRRSIPLESLKIHEIYPEMLRGMPVIVEVLPAFHRFAEGSVLVAHNAAFDMRFLELKAERAKVRFDQPVLDTLLLSAVVHPNQELHNLDSLAERLGLPVVGRHTALGDAILTAEALLLLIPLLEAKGIGTLAEAREASRKTQYAKIRF